MDSFLPADEADGFYSFSAKPALGELHAAASLRRQNLTAPAESSPRFHRSAGKHTA